MYRNISLDKFDLARFYKQVSSTMDTAREVLLSEVSLDRPNWSGVILAEQQSAGRGRQGRSWFASQGSLMATFIFSSDLGLAALAGYSLSVGAAVARLLHRIGVPVKLKWPNDIVVLNSEIYGVGKGGIAYRKLGGILVEVEEYCGYKCILVGLGLNLSAPPADVRAIGVGVSELTGEDLSVEQIIGPLANELQSAHNLFVSGGGFGAVREIWSSYSCFVPNVTKLKIDLGEGVGEISGVYQGIGSAGSLLISDDGVMREVLSGHILE